MARLPAGSAMEGIEMAFPGHVGGSSVAFVAVTHELINNEWVTE